MQASRPDPHRRNEHSRRAILDAALALTGELGYERASIEAIAKRAGVGKSTIYRWWPSKGAVLLEAIGDAAAPTVEPAESGDRIADLRATFIEVVNLLGPASDGNLRTAYQGLIGAAQSDPALCRAHRDLLIEPIRAAFRRRVTRAQEQGEIRSDIDIGTLNDMLTGAIYYRLLLHTQSLDPEQIDAALDIALNGLRPVIS